MRSSDTTLSTFLNENVHITCISINFLSFECLILLLSACKKSRSILHPFQLSIQDPENRNNVTT